MGWVGPGMLTLSAPSHALPAFVGFALHGPRRGAMAAPAALKSDRIAAAIDKPHSGTQGSGRMDAAPGVSEINIGDVPTCLSDSALDAAAQRIGRRPREVCWIAPVGLAAISGDCWVEWNVYRPRTARESTWAIERALTSTHAATVAAWLPQGDVACRRTELRLLRRLRGLARRYRKSVVLLRHGGLPV